MSINVAVVGATGNVGREVLTILDERLFPITEIHVLASRNSLGREISFGDKTLKCKDIETFDFTSVDLVFMATSGEMAKQWAPRIARDGALVVDNSSAFRMDPNVPLVIPEVNPDAVLEAAERRIIANPNCSTIQMLVALKPIHDAVGISRVNVSTYQATSGAGKAAMDELWNQTRGLFVTDVVEPEQFQKRIAFNVIPQIDVFLDDDSGDTREERKMREETAKIMDPSVKVNATCVRVPVFAGHSEAIHLEMNKPMSAEEVRDLLRQSPGCMVVDKREDGGYVTPIEATGEFAVYISRIREDVTVKNGINMWVVSDNLRKGAALNAVQIAELALNRGMFST